MYDPTGSPPSSRARTRSGMSKRPSGIEVDRARLERVHAHAHDVRELGLLLVSGHDVHLARRAGDLQNAVVHVHYPPVRRDRHRVARSPVDVEELPVVQVGEQVPVHREQALVEAAQPRERARRPERLGLVEVLDRHAAVRAVRESALIRWPR